MRAMDGRAIRQPSSLTIERPAWGRGLMRQAILPAILIMVRHCHFALARFGSTIHATARREPIAVVRADADARIKPGRDGEGAVFGHNACSTGWTVHSPFVK